ncbi:hypothetical protein PILCRDRAFT_91663 [Piloderma croceum F 1598]|uniref:Uncharacterized protein n=1 Tax=Piloderma croceum (strain F 1598) TaxID=765440 RepID=A0A0C3F8P4_PILCF|nr:hypothetical protein PILCRDRAFT_91663 [Piloderma croceum F 1598]
MPLRAEDAEELADMNGNNTEYDMVTQSATYKHDMDMQDSTVKMKEDAIKARDVALGPKKDHHRATVYKRRKPLTNGSKVVRDELDDYGIMRKNIVLRNKDPPIVTGMSRTAFSRDGMG